jgi:hypothetical protein
MKGLWIALTTDDERQGSHRVLSQSSIFGQNPNAQFIAVCSSSILAETLGYAVAFRAHDVENGAL